MSRARVQALTKIDEQEFDAATLDLNLNGEGSYPVAEYSRRRSAYLMRLLTDLA